MRQKYFRCRTIPEKSLETFSYLFLRYAIFLLCKNCISLKLKANIFTRFIPKVIWSCFSQPKNFYWPTLLKFPKLKNPISRYYCKKYALNFASHSVAVSSFRKVRAAAGLFGAHFHPTSPSTWHRHLQKEDNQQGHSSWKDDPCGENVEGMNSRWANTPCDLVKKLNWQVGKFSLQFCIVPSFAFKDTLRCLYTHLKIFLKNTFEN